MSFYLYSIIPVALLMSISHCLGMCGGFVLALNSKFKGENRAEILALNFIYHIFRVFAYTILGALAGYFGEIFSFSAKSQAILHFFIGILLVIFGVALIVRGKILAFIENDRIYQKIFAKPVKKALSSKSKFSFATLGFLNGFLPCGVVYTFLAMSAISANALNGAIIMAVFGIFTIPSLLSFSCVLNLLKLKFKNVILTLGSIFIIAFGLYHSFLGFLASR